MLFLPAVTAALESVVPGSSVCPHGLGCCMLRTTPQSGHGTLRPGVLVARMDN
ncbi:hypothetical protein PF005_g462 [Phytophthora fragariae]|uniref:Uncharacterized protein n=1 Tax=Phytophthora fragariae TaxID=53985 RepID=A0A6A3USN3_9STRA|nr:hypothetical protein PF009_g3667 [Phytophthora fragariae]KAE9017565.1 hypothetical protein PF011_g6645 [Phytophthora fragariae]KAE9114588.1 hypothetical protein PF010_g9650 [Phytophthora fragariae]KAE9140920.1 hypothetical protein PF007_g468 [Phytophthora fragariae]KAE9153410.1 hypothetical protein PF006_g2462 [Phytophthora fragariae]